jgi:hypothetical protein
MIRLIETGLFQPEEIADELTFAGLREVSQHRMLHAAPYLATATFRTGVHSSLHAAFVAGIGSDQDLTNAIDAAETNTDRNALILQRAHLDAHVATVKEFEAQYTTAFLAGITDDPTYRSLLSGLGLQDWKVNALAGIADAKAAATLKRIADAAERVLQRQTITAERKAALQNFKSGNIDTLGYGAALLLTGLSPAQVTAWTDLAALQIIGSAVKVFGMTLTPAVATLTRERVTALTDQRKRQMITDTVYVDALKALGLPAVNINALRAAADAMLTPAKSAKLIPVET